jgi:hypothetical protein
MEQTLELLSKDAGFGTDVSPADTDISQPHSAPQKVDPSLAAKGLGPAGAVPIPQEMWDALAPADFATRANLVPSLPHSSNPTLHALASKLVQDGLLLKAPPNMSPNTKAFLIPKTSEKVSLIVDMRLLNSLCGKPHVNFKLPSLDDLAQMCSLIRSHRLSLFFTKLDVSNHFWSCKLPEEAKYLVRFGVLGDIFAIPSLAFGWSFSPVMAQMLLGLYLAKANPQGVVIIQYMDDILLSSFSATDLLVATRTLVQSLQSDGWILSPKSVTIPTQAIQWMGKSLDGTNHSIANLPAMLASLVRLWLRLATLGYSQRTLRRLIGKLIWATRPGRAASPFLAGSFSWLHWGPFRSKFTPPKILRGLLEAIAIAFHPWFGQPCPGSSETWYVDAARQFHSFYVGLWAPPGKLRITQCPPWVKSQQAAELFAVEFAIRVAAYEGKRALSVATDNMAAVFSTLHTKASTKLHAQNRILRRMQHLMRWACLHVSISWVPSDANPADPLSRWAEFPDGRHMLEKLLDIESKVPCPTSFGTIFYRS